METINNRELAISAISTQDDFEEKGQTALLYLMEAFNNLVRNRSLMTKSTMAMNMAYVSLYFDAIQKRYEIPFSSVCGWEDAFIADELAKANG